MNRSIKAALPCLLALTLAVPAGAHDFWLEPSTFAAEAPATVSLGLRVGEKFEGSVVRRQSRAIARFDAAGPSGLRDVAGVESRDPAGFLQVEVPGLYAVAYETRGQRIELDAATFESYLEEEGLERVIDERLARGESQASGRELFIRCAKALVQAGGEAVSAHGPFDRSLGLTLELLLEEDPRGAVTEDSAFSLRALFDGAPVAGLRVVGLRRDRADEPVSGRTDAEGRVRLRSSPGEWLIKAVHMVRAGDEAPEDWKSYWASLTFAAPALEPAGEAAPPSR